MSKMIWQVLCHKQSKKYNKSNMHPTLQVALHHKFDGRSHVCHKRVCWWLLFKPSAAKLAHCWAMQEPSLVQHSFKRTFVHHLWLLLPLNAQLKQRRSPAHFLTMQSILPLDFNRLPPTKKYKMKTRNQLYLWQSITSLLWDHENIITA